MSRKILHKRGLEANLPLLDVSELAFTTDTKKLFIGSNTGNVEIANIAHITAAIAEQEIKHAAEHTTLEEKITAIVGTEANLPEGLKSVEDIAKAVEALQAEVGAGLQAAIADLATKEEAAAQLEEAKTHAETKATEALEAAKAHTDAKAVETLEAAQVQVDTKITELIGTAPETLDTIQELAGAIESLGGVDAGFTEALAGKASAVHTHAATDIVQDADHRMVSDAKIAEWDAKETVEGAQAKVDASKALVDAEIAQVKTDLDTAVAYTSTTKVALEEADAAMAARIQSLEDTNVAAEAADIDGGTF